MLAVWNEIKYSGTHAPCVLVLGTSGYCLLFVCTLSVILSDIESLFYYVYIGDVKTICWRHLSDGQQILFLRLIDTPSKNPEFNLHPFAIYNIFVVYSCTSSDVAWMASVNFITWVLITIFRKHIQLHSHVYIILSYLWSNIHCMHWSSWHHAQEIRQNFLLSNFCPIVYHIYESFYSMLAKVWKK